MLKNAIMKALPDMWFQPNEVVLTPFPKNSREFDIIEMVLEENKSDIRDVDIYRHFDSYDIVPKGISKAEGLRYLGSLLGIGPEDMIAVGDGVNDYPMFEYAGLSIGISLEDPGRARVNVGTITEALYHINASKGSDPSDTLKR
jgi:hydroxymethylpyrimidine pyrophosphatase-like HAD family hydrolase